MLVAGLGDGTPRQLCLAYCVGVGGLEWPSLLQRPSSFQQHWHLGPQARERWAAGRVRPSVSAHAWSLLPQARERWARLAAAVNANVANWADHKRTAGLWGRRQGPPCWEDVVALGDMYVKGAQKCQGGAVYQARCAEVSAGGGLDLV